MKRSVFAAMISGLLAFTSARIVQAASPIVVGDGTAASCDEAALQGALNTARSSGGGTIKFRCGTDPVTILLTTQSLVLPDYVSALDLPNNTTIDGENRITLRNDGSAEDSVIYLGPTASVTIKNLELDMVGGNFFRPLWNTGALTLQHVTISCPITMACDNGIGWIYNDGGLRVVDSTFSGSRASGRIRGRLVNIHNSAGGTVLVKSTLFTDNYGNAIWNEGVATVVDTSFIRQEADGFFGSGAAVHNYGNLSVRGSLFAQNDCGVGGAMVNGGTLELKDTTFSNNQAAWVGGALFNNGEATIDNNRFFANQANSLSGGAVHNLGSLIVRNSVFSGNIAGPHADGYGGAIYTGFETSVTISNSQLSGNFAGFGGAIANGGQDRAFTLNSPEGGHVAISNTTISGNTAAQHGGGIYNYGAATLTLSADTQVVSNTPDDTYTAPSELGT